MYAIVGRVASYYVVFVPCILMEPHVIAMWFRGIKDQFEVKTLLVDSLMSCVYCGKVVHTVRSSVLSLVGGG